MEDWEDMVSRSDEPGSLADQTSVTGAPFGVSSGYSMTGAEDAAPVSAGALFSAGAHVVATAYEGAKAEVGQVLDAAEERAARVGSSLKWWALGGVVAVLAVAAIVFAPELKGAAKLTGVA